MLCAFKKPNWTVLFGGPFVDWVALDAVHTAGGVLVTPQGVFEKVDYVVGTFFVSILFKGVADGYMFGFVRGVWSI